MTADEGDGLVALKETDKLVDDLAQSYLHPCPSSLASISSRRHNLRLAVFGEQIVQRLVEQILNRDLVGGGAASLDRQFSRTLSTGRRTLSPSPMLPNC